jgi:transketolase
VNEKNFLTDICEEIRKWILKLSYSAKSAHVGSSLSAVEILATLFQLKRSTASFFDSTLILSKGHAAMSLYATAIAFGELSSDLVDTYLKDGSSLWGHPSVNKEHPFINWSTGSLGHGLPVATGVAYAQSILKNKQAKIVTVLSDGELNEGSNWEAILFASHHKLHNLIAVVDYNKIQSFGRCEDVMALEPLVDKWRAFGWRTIEVDGHNPNELHDAITSAGDTQPLAVIGHTIKGKGVSEIEDTLESHYRPVSDDLYRKYTQ